MVEDLLLVEAESTVPYRNIAVEKYLMDHVQPGQCYLYLWQNAHTVVIGRNQSALGECRVAELEAAGGHLARRLSGGGAVYHDLGNLNFTFVARRDDYDVARQTSIILAAMHALGIPAERTGRNDLTAGGRKFSGHAYYRSGDSCYHHGTLMVDVALEEMGRFLKPAPDKLAAKGVQSVRSRVANLSDFVPGLAVAQVADALKAAFGAEFGLVPRIVAVASFDQDELAASEGRFHSRAWLLRDELEQPPEGMRMAKDRFGWGGVTLRYALDGGAVAACSIDSDGLEADYLAALPSALTGCAFERNEVLAALQAEASTDGQRAIAKDIADLLFSTD